jgi:VIT1/CCC1 family predicted Fe2+/Mn2+ transporter
MKSTCTILFFILSISSFAQAIEITQSIAGIKFLREDAELSSKQVQQLLSVDETLSLEFKKSRKLYTYSGITGFAGGLLVMLPVSTLILGGDNPEWALAGAGAALLGVSFALSKSSGKKAQDSIDQYNLSYGNKTGMRPSIILSGQGIGINIKF